MPLRSPETQVRATPASGLQPGRQSKSSRETISSCPPLFSLTCPADPLRHADHPPQDSPEFPLCVPQHLPFGVFGGSASPEAGPLEIRLSSSMATDLPRRDRRQPPTDRDAGTRAIRPFLVSKEYAQANHFIQVPQPAQRKHT